MAEETTALGGVSNGAQAQGNWRDDVAARVLAEVKELEARCAALATLLADAKQEHRDALAILKTIDPDLVPSPKKKKSGDTHKGGASEAVCVGLAGGILRSGDLERFTLLQIHHEVLNNPWSEAHSYVAMKWLRDHELVGKGGKDPDSKRQTWRVLDREALEALAQQAEG